MSGGSGLSTTWLVWKFGGTSMANTQRILNVANLVSKHCNLLTSPSSSSSSVYEFSKTIEARTSLASFLKFGCDYDNELMQTFVDLHSSSSSSSSLECTPLYPYKLAVVVSALAGITDALCAACVEAAAEFHATHLQFHTSMDLNYSSHATITPDSSPKMPQMLLKQSSFSIGKYYYEKDMKDQESCNILHFSDNTAKNQLKKNQILNDIKQRHFNIMNDLKKQGEIEYSAVDEFQRQFDKDMDCIKEMLRAFSLSGFCATGLKEVILGHGELWSSRILYYILQKRFLMSFSNTSSPLLHQESSTAATVTTITTARSPNLSDEIECTRIYSDTNDNCNSPHDLITLDKSASVPIINSNHQNSEKSFAPEYPINNSIICNQQNNPSFFQYRTSDMSTCKYCPSSPIQKSISSDHNCPSLISSCQNRPICWLDARKVLITTNNSSNCNSSHTASSLSSTTFPSSTDNEHNERVSLNFDLSKRLMDDWLQCHPECRVIVATGYICSLPTGCPTTFKRNGSDYSGSLFAALLHASLYTVWTDVDGIYSADPRIVSTAFRLPFVSYIEAIELAYFGAKVLHPLTMEPCIKANIPIVLRSSIEPQKPGTLIATELPSSFSTNNNLVVPYKKVQECCRAFTLINKMSLISIYGSSIIGVPGIASRLFTAVHEARCSVTMISQASSEHSICFCVPSHNAERVKIAVESAFCKEMVYEKTMRIKITPHCSLLCAVGEKMCGSMGILGDLTQAFAKAHVNIKAVAQGSSELNVTFVVSTDEATPALQALHDAVYQSSSEEKITLNYNNEHLNTGALKNSAQVEKAIPNCFSYAYLILVPTISNIIDEQTFKTVNNLLSSCLLSVSSCIIGYTDGVYFKANTMNNKSQSFFFHTTTTLDEILYATSTPMLLLDFRIEMLEDVTTNEISGTTNLVAACSLNNENENGRMSLLEKQKQFFDAWKNVGKPVLKVSDLLNCAFQLKATDQKSPTKKTFVGLSHDVVKLWNRLL